MRVRAQKLSCGIRLTACRETWWSIIGVALIIAAVAAPLRAQVESGQIAGTVSDPTGAVVPGAAVVVTNTATSAARHAETTGNGTYEVTGLEPAKYTLTVTSGNFKPFSATVEVTVGGHVTVDAKLSVSANVTEVQVLGEGGATVNTQSQELSQVVNPQQLANLPSLTRNPYDFVTLSGNVSAGDNTTNSMNSGQSLTARGVGVSINGQRQSGTEILLDGVENVGVFNLSVGDQTPVDSVQEYSVITNNFSAEYGRASGGVVNLTTRSGGNEYHGSVWDYNRLSAYTANTYANDAANAAAGSIVAPKGKYTRNQFGYAGGGPILRDRLFLFESTEWTRVRSSAAETEEVLDPGFIAMLPSNAQAYFNAFGKGVVAASGAVTTAGQLAAAGDPLGRINGTTPIPSSTPIFDSVNFTAPFDAGGDVPQNTYRLAGRLDYTLNEKTTMFFRGARESENQFIGSYFYSAYPQYDVGTEDVNQSYLYSLSHSFNTNLFDNLKLSFSRFNDANSFDQTQVGVPMLMIVPPADPVTNGIVQLPGLENVGNPAEGGLPYGGPQNTIQPEDDLAWTKGAHSLRFGGQFTYIQLNVAYGAYAQAVEELGGSLDDSLNDLIDAAGNPGGSTLIQFQTRVNAEGHLPCHATPTYWESGSTSDLVQTPDCAVTPPLPSAVYGRSYRYRDWAAYAQDSFRITPRLTLNYGLRYEHYGVQHNNKPDLDSNFYFGSGSNVEQKVRSGGVQIADKSPVGGFWMSRWGMLAPRVGFAYDVFGNGTTSLRGGYGISYERNFGNVTYNASFNPPASAVLSSVCSAGSASCSSLVTNDDLGPLGLPGPPSYLGPSELRMPDPQIEVAQTQFWSLALQHELTHNTVAELSYSGAKGTHLYDIENINLLGAGQYYLGDPIAFAQYPGCTSPCLTRPNDQFSNINMRGSQGSSAYDALNLRLQSENLRNSGLSMIANYTWAHSLDDLSSTFSDTLQQEYVGSLGYTDALDPALDWGSSDYDVRNRLTLSPIWETPWFHNGSKLAKDALGGWTLSGIVTVRSGIPFSVYDASNELNYYTVPRLTPATPVTSHRVGSPKMAGPNVFTALNLPLPASFAPLDPELGISDFGPFPANMTRRNSFTGPGAWNSDVSLSKRFPITERVGLELHAEGFDVFNHHNYYINSTLLQYNGATTTPLQVTELKGGLGSLATGGNHDERRFGQFALKATF